MIGRWRKLRSAGVMSINERNLNYIFENNPRNRYPLADDKLKMKALALANNIAVPELYGCCSAVGELRDLEGFLQKYSDFVIKPSRGAGGEGVLVIESVSNGEYLTPSGNYYSLAQVRHHITSILSGLYSLGGRPDKAMIEYRVKFDPVFSQITYHGVPDIRIIVYQGVPAMAMLRLPTRKSQGRANLHQGAIGAGISIASGMTTSGVMANAACSQHPDTGESIIGVQIPWWPKLLEIASACSDLTGLGYLGVDLVLDQNLGPLLLEINARPGLSIQIANSQGLLIRLRRIKKNISELDSATARLEFARAQFP